MKTTTQSHNSRVYRRLLHSPFAVALLSLLLLALSAPSSYADSATWNLNPTNGDWNTADNWTPPTVPDGSTDVATFDLSNTIAVSLSAATKVDSIIFNPGASSYTIATPFELNLGGLGIINNSGVTQSFVVLQIPGNINFRNSATAGDAHFRTGPSGGVITGVAFYDTASAANATFVNRGGDLPGVTVFFDSSTAANAMVTNHLGNSNGAFTLFLNNSYAGTATSVSEGEGQGNSGVQFRGHSSAHRSTIIAGGGGVGQGGQIVTFTDYTTAGSATIIANGGTRSSAPGGLIIFYSFLGGAATAENSTLIANSGSNGGLGGMISFSEATRGHNARVELADGTVLTIEFHRAPGTSLGSIEGAGRVILGANNLTTGKNNLDTTFSGIIEDGTSAGGSLTKVGTGNLTLTTANSYTGGTIVNEGILLVNNTIGSATGTGAVQVMAGTLGGSGIIEGAVAVGTARGPGAILGPGNGTIPGTLTIQNKLTLKQDATCRIAINSSTPAADQVIANGIRIRGAQIVFDDFGTSVLPSGTTFTVLSNTAATAITGTFSNLADGSTITVGSNTFEVSYEGGDGNDLTLTVVP